MSDFYHAFSDGVLSPDEVRLLQRIFARVSVEAWFTRNAERRSAFASFILHVYRRGMVVPDKLEALCRTAARAHFVSDQGIVVPQDGLGGNKILVVEDEALLARDVMKRLTATGAAVIGPVATVGDAIELVEEIELDGALLDIALDGELVYPVAALLRMKKVPFAFVSGHDKPDVPMAFRNVAVFPKPADWAKVAAYLTLYRDPI